MINVSELLFKLREKKFLRQKKRKQLGQDGVLRYFFNCIKRHLLLNKMN